MKVLKLINVDVAKKLDYTTKGNRKLDFVPDGNGALIVGLEVLEDPIYKDIKEELESNCDVIDYVTTEDKNIVVKTDETKYDSIIIKK